MNDDGIIYTIGFVLGLGVVFVACAVAGWLILKITKFILSTPWREATRRRQAEEIRQREIAARAELQNQEYLAGNSHGIYGDFEPRKVS